MKHILTTLFIISTLSIGLWSVINVWYAHNSAAVEGTAAETPPASPEPASRVVVVPITPGATYAELITDAGVDYGVAMAIHEAAVDDYDLASVRAGSDLQLTFDENTGELVELYYQSGADNELRVSRSADGVWHARYAPIPYEIRTKTYRGTVESSLYEAALASGIDERAIIAFADAFQWTIDFVMDPRAGDTFEFVIEERFINNNYVMPRQVLAGRYVNAGTTYTLYYFEEDEDNTGYFDTAGNSVQTIFLKAPVAFRYISSGFTTGLRYVKAFNVATGHRAIDYAADYGTPIRATGAGTATFAGWNSQGYGNLVSIHHNATYSTNYAHMSKIAVTRGDKVAQGEVIGYVGSTGFSTGPHVHYEMVKHGTKINPLTEVLPPGEPVAAENRGRFTDEKMRLDELLER